MKGLIIAFFLLLSVCKLHAQEVVFRTDTADGFDGVFCIGPLVLPKDPLILIDDKSVYIKEFKKLDTKNFAHVRMVKDSMAMLLYGPSAKNGAVIVTTKNKKKAKK
ncbi:MAG: hypothetical protein EOP47_17710 [Sphingobacteriaceae bacterium]|nr:MAG: hypothetical protein EOP47_17710 [Sphingobacteriaceae bacterium]